MATWIDFKQLRERVPIVDLLQQHNVQLKVRGDTATGLCPLPTHPVRSDSSKRSASFSVHLRKGIWHCFGCGAKGNVLDLATRLQGLDPEVPSQLRTAALRLAERFGIECERLHERRHANAAASANSSIVSGQLQADVAPRTSDPTQRVVINEPIDFELKNLDTQHPYLLARALTPPTIFHFGLGYCSRGMMCNRIAIPVHDPAGRLVGYAGRLVDDDKAGGDHPKYLFPGQRTRDGVIHEFRKSSLVYNLHRIAERVRDVIVVEGFASVWWLHQNGYRNVVALMGNSCSSEQASLITGHVAQDGRIWLLPDGNGAGAQLAAQALSLLAVYRFTFLVKLKEHEQPTDCSPADLAGMFADIQRT